MPGELSGTVAACAASISSPPLGFAAGRVSRRFTAGSLDGSTHRQNPQLPCDPQSPKITVTDAVFSASLSLRIHPVSMVMWDGDGVVSTIFLPLLLLTRTSPTQ